MSTIQSFKKSTASQGPQLGYGCPLNPGDGKMKNDKDLMALTDFLGGGD